MVLACDTIQIKYTKVRENWKLTGLMWNTCSVLLHYEQHLYLVNCTELIFSKRSLQCIVVPMWQPVVLCQAWVIYVLDFFQKQPYEGWCKAKVYIVLGTLGTTRTLPISYSKLVMFKTLNHLFFKMAFWIPFVNIRKSLWFSIDNQLYCHLLISCHSITSNPWHTKR